MSQETIEKFIDNINTIQLDTKKNLKACLRKLIHKGCSKDPVKAFSDYNHILSVLTVMINDYSKRVFLSRMFSINKHYFNETQIKLIPDDVLELLNPIYNNLVETNIDTCNKQQYKPIYSLNEIYDIHQQYTEDSFEYLFLACYLLIPTRRRDWGHAIFVEKLPDTIDTTKNYVIIDKENNKVSLHFNRPRKVSGVYTTELLNKNYNYLDKLPYLNPEKLGQLLINSYTSNKRTYVFMKNADQWTNKTKFLKKHHSKFCINVIRHAFSQVVFNLKNMSEYDLKFISNDFGDSIVNTFRLYSHMKTNEIGIGEDSGSDSEVDSEEESDVDSEEEDDVEDVEEINEIIELKIDTIEQNILNLIMSDKNELIKLQERIAKRQTDLELYRKFKNEYL